ncbi:MAG TPA: cupredoxin family copper-binding protein [Candidatus Hydromicrobium sp.]
MKIFKRNLWLIILLSALFLFFTLVSCQTDTGQPAAGTGNGQETVTTQNGNEVQIEMRNSRFSPETVTIKQGTTVTWVNEDLSSHTITSGERNNESGIFDSGNISSGGSFSYTFNDKGTFNYFCKLHPGMEGTIEVE